MPLKVAPAIDAIFGVLQEEATAVITAVLSLISLVLSPRMLNRPRTARNAAAICVGAVRLDIGVDSAGSRFRPAEDASALQGAVIDRCCRHYVSTRQGDSTAAVENGAAIVGDIRSEPA